MIDTSATEEYSQALRAGQKEYRELLMAGKNPHPAVLDELHPESATDTVVELGLVEIPVERIVGTKSAGRTTAFTATFRPLLDHDSEFAIKWKALCSAHLGDIGITDPIICFEYLGDFYVQEGNKRVSVLRHFDAARIPGTVKRILPPQSEDPRIRAYYEFIEFYKGSKLYAVQFRRPGIVGYGSIGRLVAYKLSVFGCRILVADPFLKECKEDYVTLVPMDELLAQADIVTLHARSNGAVMTDREFGLMKQNSYLINTARPYLVDFEAFLRAMDSGKLLGAAFDVFETEPVIPEAYRKYDNITITNHLGGLTINSYSDAPGYAIKNYLNYINGKADLAFFVNRNQLA